MIDALEGLSIDLPIGTTIIRAEDHQAVTTAPGAKPPSDPGMPIRILKPIKLFPGKDITPSVEETGCKMKK